ncbi:hypothetical protein DS739_12920 [Acetobacter sp. JWB]|nr:hypothetical protein CPF11_07490 [Acetobacter pomorum]AXC27551.1 hypothetical protein DS739_12920 [Acetobacter sp. JWB]KGB23521.1 hypothetical protein ApDm4_1915 [Acetobacter pomorum]
MATSIPCFPLCYKNTWKLLVIEEQTAQAATGKKPPALPAMALSVSNNCGLNSEGWVAYQPYT